MENSHYVERRISPYLVKSIGVGLTLFTVIGSYNFISSSRQDNQNEVALKSLISSNNNFGLIPISSNCIPRFKPELTNGPVGDNYKSSSTATLYPTGQIISKATTSTNQVELNSSSNIADLYPTGQIIQPKASVSTIKTDKCVLLEKPKFNVEMLKKSNIFTPDQINQLISYSPIYEAAASKYNLPWQLLATIHWRETNLAMTNPSNYNGLFQIYNSYFQPGQVSNYQFQNEVDLAAKLLATTYSQKAKIVGGLKSGNSINMVNIGNILMSYNGQSPFYYEQATTMGYDQPRLAFLGSPYVSNLIDSNFNSAYNSNWKQIRYDHSYALPADQRPGTLPVFTLLMQATAPNIELDFTGIDNSIKNSLISRY